MAGRARELSPPEGGSSGVAMARLIPHCRILGSQNPRQSVEKTHRHSSGKLHRHSIENLKRAGHFLKLCSQIWTHQWPDWPETFTSVWACGPICGRGPGFPVSGIVFRSPVVHIVQSISKARILVNRETHRHSLEKLHSCNREVHRHAVLAQHHCLPDTTRSSRCGVFVTSPRVLVTSGSGPGFPVSGIVFRSPVVHIVQSISKARILVNRETHRHSLEKLHSCNREMHRHSVLAQHHCLPNTTRSSRCGVFVTSPRVLVTSLRRCTAFVASGCAWGECWHRHCALAPRL